MSEEALNLLKNIQQTNFAAYDMLLYLDTHAGDKKAFEMYKSLIQKRNMQVDEFQKNFGPLSQSDAALQESFNWLDNPWPWEKEGNR